MTTRIGNEKVLLEAEFDPRLQAYWTITALIVGLFTCVGMLWVPFQIMINRRRFESLSCELTERSLHIRKGFIFKVEKTIPLDKIQDLSLHEGPLLRYLGLCSLHVETAGQGTAQGQSDAALSGVVNATEFRNAVIERRDLVTGMAPTAAPVAAPGAGRDDVLDEIRDSVRNIERLLEERAGDARA